MIHAPCFVTGGVPNLSGAGEFDEAIAGRVQLPPSRRWKKVR